MPLWMAAPTLSGGRPRFQFYRGTPTIRGFKIHLWMAGQVVDESPVVDREPPDREPPDREPPDREPPDREPPWTENRRGPRAVPACGSWAAPDPRHRRGVRRSMGSVLGI